MAKDIKRKFKSPKGRAQFPWLTKADTKFDSDGVYKTGLIVPAAKAQKLVDICEEIADEAFDAKKRKKVNMPFEEDDDGNIVFKVKSYNKPGLFDSKGTRVKVEFGPNRGGSEIRIAGTAKAYSTGGNVGVTLYMNSVKILSLADGANPWDDEEDEDEIEGEGFVAGDEPDADEDDDADDSNEDTDDDGEAEDF